MNHNGKFNYMKTRESNQREAYKNCRRPLFCMYCPGSDGTQSLVMQPDMNTWVGFQTRHANNERGGGLNTKMGMEIV